MITKALLSWDVYDSPALSEAGLALGSVTLIRPENLGGRQLGRESYRNKPLHITA